MEFREKMQNTPPKRSGHTFGFDLTDVTILSTPRPQASSTVERRTFTTGQHPRMVSQNPPNRKSNILEDSCEISLGLINNITNLLEEHDKSVQETSTRIANKIETERELARQLIHQCEYGKLYTAEIETNKENNVNTQNLIAHTNDKAAIATAHMATNSVIFEPHEFTARSSELNTNTGYNETLKSSHGHMDNFSFNSVAADIMAKFTDTDFVAGSRISSQFSADELSCRQNFNAIPATSERERLEFSCFSGIVGESDLTVDSCGGRRVSVGEFFRRKCGALGNLNDHTQIDDRPSFGLSQMKSPDRSGSKPGPLVNESAVSVSSNIAEESELMSLTKIAQALQKLDGTPSRFVDELLMTYKKQNSEQFGTNDMSSATYAVPPLRSSLPVMLSMALNKSEENSMKHSFDSRTITNESTENIRVIKETISIHEKPHISALPEQSVKQLPLDDSPNIKLEEKSSGNIKQEQNSLTALTRINEKIFIGKSQELYKCMIGVPREAAIEIRNESERWFKCTLNLLQIQGDQSNVEINVPSEAFVVEPNQLQVVKLFINLRDPNMRDPIMAALAVDIIDMSTREIFTKQHMMCFIPELSSSINASSHSIKENFLVEEQTRESRCSTPQILPKPGEFSCTTSPHRTSSSTSGRNSPRSTASSAGTVSGDSIPIKSTHSLLAWTSVRIGKYEVREFTIRNTSSNKIKLQGVITDNDNSFKFLKDRESSTTITFGLQHMESKTFTVVFQPNNKGAAAGKITFTHYEKKRENKDTRPSRIIPLYGYGGYAKICISQALKIMGNQMWLSLGKLSLSGTLNTQIKLENNGDLSAYAKITLAPKAVYPSVESNWHIEPTELILGPKEVKWVSLQFHPRKEDLAVLSGDVAEMGTLIITHGDEPTRWRIRRLYNKMREAGQIKRNEEADIFQNVVYPICKEFSGETSIPTNLNIIRDSLQDLGMLCRQVNRHVVTLTMETSGDETMAIFHDDDDDFDESQMFQSLCSDVTAAMVSNENSYMPPERCSKQTNSRTQVYEDEFTVSPRIITLTPPSFVEDIIDITSTSSTAQPFETMLSHQDFFRVLPCEGMIPARGVVRIKIQCKKRVDENFDAMLQIYTANEKREVIIKIRL